MTNSKTTPAAKTETLSDPLTGHEWRVSGSVWPRSRRASIHAERITPTKGEPALTATQVDLVNRLITLGVWSVWLDDHPETSATVLSGTVGPQADHVSLPLGRTYFDLAWKALAAVLTNGKFGPFLDFTDKVWAAGLDDDRWCFDYWAFVDTGEVIEAPPVGTLEWDHPTAPADIREMYRTERKTTI